LSLVLAIVPPAFAGGGTNTVETASATLETNVTAEVMRAYLELQQQLHEARLAIERSRQDAETAAAHNAEVVAVRLKALEDSLAARRSQELAAIEAMQTTNRLMIKIGSVCAAAGFLALLLTAYFQWRAVSRLADFSVLSPALGRWALPSPGAAELPAVGGLPEPMNTRLLGALERLEQRILELENIARAPLSDRNSANGATAADEANVAGADRVPVLLAKGESLMHLDKPEEALACYDEILALAPDHADALVKRGDALERLHRIEEAIACFDRAIATGGSLTVAYLHKGGLFNRLERYEEALHCYEQALRTQEKSHAA
jgi:tetratricopeptide (TPR) repeat protein